MGSITTCTRTASHDGKTAVILIQDTWAAALESLPIAVALRGSVWAYPLINAGHVLGVALLIGGIVPLDLRLLGVWPSVPLPPLWRVLVITAGTGLGLATICGGLLFVTRATAYAGSSLFAAKMVLVGLGLANALILHLLIQPKSLPSVLPWPIRFQAALSLSIWFAVLTLGRLVGYF
jgi:hypothetical protein